MPRTRCARSFAVSRTARTSTMHAGNWPKSRCTTEPAAFPLLGIDRDRGQRRCVPQVRHGGQIGARTTEDQRIALAILQLREPTVRKHSGPRLIEEHYRLRLDAQAILARAPQIKKRVLNRRWARSDLPQ